MPFPSPHCGEGQAVHHPLKPWIQPYQIQIFCSAIWLIRMGSITLSSF